MSNSIHKAYGHDQLWKHIIEDFFFHFVRYFMPALVPLVDFSVTPTFLDQQLKPRICISSPIPTFIGCKSVK